MKKTLLYLITVLLLALSACSSDNAEQEEHQSSKIEGIRLKAISDFYGNQTRRDLDFSKADKEHQIILTNNLEANLSFALNNNAYTLLENNNINVSIIDALIDYDTNYRSQEHGFELVVQKYNLNERDVYFLAFSIETFDYLIDSTLMETRSGKTLVSCATAVVGSVITTVGATTIATGWGLGLFLVGKAVSLVGVAMCAS